MTNEVLLKRATRIRADGREQLLVYLRPDLIKQLKIAALDEDRYAYELTEQAICEWLASRNKAQKRKDRR